MILVVSHAGDGHLAPVGARLDQAGTPWMLLDTDEYPDRMTIADGPSGCALYADGRCVALSEVTAVWWRRPQPPVISGRPVDIARWSERQAFAALDSALSAIDGLWVNHPRCNRRAEDKQANLRRAGVLGLHVPDWCVTNDPAAARAFAREQEAIVVKAVESAYVARDRSMWTRRLEDFAWLDRIGPEPYLLQRFIDKTEDLRAVVVGDEVFAVGIESQATSRTSVDMRAGDLRELRHRAVELPADVHCSLLALCASLELRFAAIDLARDHEGRYWFLEANPNGQWAWLEELAGVPIADALVRLLTS